MKNLFDANIKIVVNMKSKIFYSFVILILTFTSCHTKRTNIIVGGQYLGVDSKNQLVSCDLFIEQIS